MGFLFNKKGHFSTVWLALNKTNNLPVALKVVKAAKHYTEAALDEIALLTKASNKTNNYVVNLVDFFKHKGANGTRKIIKFIKDICMAFEVLGQNLLALIKQKDHRGIDILSVKRMAKQILIGLLFLLINTLIILVSQLKIFDIFF